MAKDVVHKFVIDPERVTLDELIELEEVGTNVSLRMAKGLLSRHIVGADGEYLEQDAAMAVVGKFNLVELNDAVAKFIAATEVLGVSLVPEAQGSS